MPPLTSFVHALAWTFLLILPFSPGKPFLVLLSSLCNQNRVFQLATPFAGTTPAGLLHHIGSSPWYPLFLYPSRDNHSLSGVSFPGTHDTVNTEWRAVDTFLTFLCLLMRWTAETAWHAWEQTRSLVSPWNFKVSAFTAYWLNWSSNTPRYCSLTHNVHKRMGHGCQQQPRPHAVNITFRGHETCCLHQFDNNFKHRCTALEEPSWEDISSFLIRQSHWGYDRLATTCDLKILGGLR